ncbi:MAG: hypothetical protein U0892_09925 [Pirellulales bacterium]
MFKAVGKYVRAVWYLMTFRVDKAGETLRMNPGVVSANYDRIIDEKRKRLNQYKDAVSAMIAQEESKKEKLRTVTEEVGKLEKLRSGAAAKAKKLVEQYIGDVEAVKRDPEYLKCQAAFKDFSSTLAEKQQRANEIEEDLKQLVANVGGHKTQIQSLMRELDKLKEEKHDAVADIAFRFRGKANRRHDDRIDQRSHQRRAAGCRNCEAKHRLTHGSAANWPVWIQRRQKQTS